jgi:gliding motility-associated lipoprotein GldH
MRVKKRGTLYNKWLAAACCSLLFMSCTQTGVFEKSTGIPNYDWKSSFAIKGDFSITDTVSFTNAYIVLRHTDAYRYNNIWLTVGIQAPGDSMHYKKVDLQLGTDAEGWAGSGMNDIWELRQLIFSQPFKKAGTYQYTINQIMRDDPLTGVMSAGLRIEKQ